MVAERSHPVMSEPAILDHLEHVQAVGSDHWRACCPTHESASKASLSVAKAGDRTLLYDFGGCDNQRILDALGLDWTVLFDTSAPRTAHRPATAQPAMEPLGILLACPCGAEYLRLRGGIQDGLVVCAAGHPAPAVHAAEIARQVNLVRQTEREINARDVAWLAREVEAAR